MIFDLLTKLSQTSSRNEKLKILESTLSNPTLVESLKRFFELTFDKVRFKYYITNKVLDYSKSGPCDLGIETLYETILEPLSTRQFTGNAAIEHIQLWIDKLTPECQHILKCIIDRDLHCGVDVKTIEKVFGNITFKLPYMRCSLIESLKNVKFPAILQLKADGTYRTAIVRNGEVEFYSRSGEPYEHHKLANEMKHLPDGAYIGELLVLDTSIASSKASEARYISNGALNSLNPPEDVKFYVWDFLPLDEFLNGFSNTPYIDRLSQLTTSVVKCEMVETIRTWFVKDYTEAQNITKQLISQGYEGAVLKDFNLKFENKTSKHQIKLKQEIEIDVRCIGFTKGNGRFADTFGAILFKTDDNKLEGQCSGLSDSMRKEISSNRNKYLDTIFTIKCNDITKAKNSETFGVMHPQFKEFRKDKTESDTILRCLEMLKGF